MTKHVITSALVSRLVGPRELVFEREPFDSARLKSNEISVATEFSAISPGTELAAYTGQPALRPGPIYPRLVGYCNCGRVLEIGNAVTDVRAGDRVVTFAAHRSHYRLPASEIAAVVPNNLGGADASITYLFQLALVSLRRAGIRAEHRVAVIGLGALGMASVAIGKLNGAKVTAISGRVPALNQALRLGAEQVLLKGSPAIQDVHADIVVTTSNDWSDWQLALQVAGRGGVIAVLGFPGRGQGAPSFNPLDSQYFYEKQLNVMATGQLLEPEYPTSSLAVVQRENMNYLMGLMVEGALPVEEFTRHVKPSSDLAHAYEELLDRRDDVLTFVLRW